MPLPFPVLPRSESPAYRLRCATPATPATPRLNPRLCPFPSHLFAPPGLCFLPSLLQGCACIWRDSSPGWQTRVSQRLKQPGSLAKVRVLLQSGPYLKSVSFPSPVLKQLNLSGAFSLDYPEVTCTLRRRQVLQSPCVRAPPPGTRLYD